MAGSSSLFELIHSLDKQEKRYIQLFIKRNSIGGASNYLDLFGAVSKQRVHDEAAVKQALKGRPVAKSFAVTKHYLYELVLKALAAYHAGSDTDLRLAGMLHRAGLLFDKKLYTQCCSLARKTAALAAGTERAMIETEALEMEMRALHALTDTRAIAERSEKYYKRKKELLRQREELFYIQQFTYDNFVAIKTKWVDKQRSLSASYKKLKAIRPAALSTLKAKMMFYQNLAAYEFSVNDGEAALRAMEKLVTLFEEHPRLVDDNRNQYIAVLNNLTLLLFDKKDYTRILSNAAKLRALKPRSPDEKVRILERALNIELNVYKNRGEIEKSRPLLEETRKLMEDKRLGEVYRMMFHIDLFTCYFVLGDYRQALRALHIFLSESSISIREDLQKTARILAMIVHYELGNFDYFDSLLRSSKRFFSRRSKPDALGKLFLSFFHKAVSYGGSREKEAGFRELHRELEALGRDKLLYETYFKNFHFSLWAESKFIGKTLQKLIRERSS